MTDYFMAEVAENTQAIFSLARFSVMEARAERAARFLNPCPLSQLSKSYSQVTGTTEATYLYPDTTDQALRLTRLFSGSYALERLRLPSRPGWIVEVLDRMIFKWDNDTWQWTHAADVKAGWPTPSSLGIPLQYTWHILLDQHAMVVLPRSNEDVSTASWLV